VSDPEDITEEQFYQKMKTEPAEVIEELPPVKDFVDYLLSFLPDDFVAEGYE
jgi:hypothetical protein